MYRVFVVSSIAVLCMLAYASCSSWDSASEARTDRTRITVDGNTDQAQIEADARVQVAAQTANAQIAEGQALLQATQFANQTAQVVAQQNAGTVNASLSALLAVTQQNSALSSQIIALQNSTPAWVTVLITILIVLAIIGVVIGTVITYTAWRAAQANVRMERPQIAAKPTRTERMLIDNEMPFRRSGQYLITVVDGEAVKVPNI